MARIARRSLLPLIAIVLLVMTVTQLRSARGSTRALAAAPKPLISDHVSAEGRVAAYPGAEVAVGADASGVVAHVYVEERQAVKKGQLIADLAVDDLRASLDESHARLHEADADIALFVSELDRNRSLWEQRIGTKKEFERSRRDLDAARARRATSVAEGRRIEALMAKARVVSPIDGVITARSVQPGESIDRGVTVARVADLTRRRIEAEVDEFDIAHVKPGQSVEIRADGFDGMKWRGHVEEVPDTVVGRLLKPEDPGRLSDTRVLLTKVALDEPAPVKLGQRVEVTISTRP